MAETYCVYHLLTKEIWSLGSRRQMERDLKYFRKGGWFQLRMKKVRL